MLHKHLKAGVPTKNAIRQSSVANFLNIVVSEDGNSADLGLTVVERRDRVVGVRYVLDLNSNPVCGRHDLCGLESFRKGVQAARRYS